MAVTPYVPHSLSPDASVSLAEISRHSLQTKAMLTALGDYWTAYYRDSAPIAQAATGFVAALSEEYVNILDLVRASSILDIPISDAAQFSLLVVDVRDVVPVYAADGSVDHFRVPVEDLVDTAFLMTSMFEAPVVLERGVHFDVERGEGYRLYVDLFNDPAIVNYAYEAGEGSDRKMLLWACDMALSSSVIYERYGRFLYRKSPDGEQYKWLVTALMRFYEHAKSNRGIQNVLDIMYGVPYTRWKDEVIRDIYYVDKDLRRLSSSTEEPYICIETDRASYYTYAFSDVLWKVGDVVPQFSLLASFNVVEDWLDAPNWWEDVAFPEELVANGAHLTVAEKNELMDKVLKYNTVHIRIGVSFDTYRTYLQQVKEFFNIIESGFPVYLYPLVDSIFKAVFIDKVDVDDEFGEILSKLSIVSRYDWQAFLCFNGEAVYYMDPDYHHGRESYRVDGRFDGGMGYYLPHFHEGEVFNAWKFDGSIAGYNTGWKVSHDNDNEILRITRLGHSAVDVYPWDDSPGLAEYGVLRYNGSATSNGWHFFGETTSEISGERVRLTMSVSGLEDVVPMPSDDADIVFACVPRPIEETHGSHFNGEYLFDGTITTAAAVDEGFSVTVTRLP